MVFTFDFLLFTFDFLLFTCFCTLSSVFCLLSSVFCLLSSVLCLLSSVLCLLISDFRLLSSVSYFRQSNPSIARKKWNKIGHFFVVLVKTRAFWSFWHRFALLFYPFFRGWSVLIEGQSVFLAQKCGLTSQIPRILRKILIDLEFSATNPRPKICCRVCLCAFYIDVKA